MVLKKIRFSRNKILVCGLVLLLALIIIRVTSPTQAAQASFASAAFEVVPFTAQIAIPEGPFEIEGNIYQLGTLNPDGTVPAGATPIGTWRSWGHNTSTTGRRVVNESYELDAFSGTIQVQGVRGKDVAAVRRNESLAVVGGTGSFNGIRGEAKIKILEPRFEAFRFTLVGSMR
jgi:hypothetical protein